MKQFTVRISAFFEGNSIEWSFPEDIDLDSVEFKAMPSGAHTIDCDFMQVTKTFLYVYLISLGYLVQLKLNAFFCNVNYYFILFLVTFEWKTCMAWAVMKRWSLTLLWSGVHEWSLLEFYPPHTLPCITTYSFWNCKCGKKWKACILLILAFIVTYDQVTVDIMSSKL